MFSSSSLSAPCFLLLFFFTDPATPEIYTLSLHDALPISLYSSASAIFCRMPRRIFPDRVLGSRLTMRSEEHTSELQLHSDLVCRLLLEKKNKKTSPSSAGPLSNLGTDNRAEPGWHCRRGD